MNTLNILKIIKNPKFNPPRTILLQLYRSLFRGKLEYTGPEFLNATQRNLSIMKTVQHAALRLCFGALPSSPIDSIYCEASELPPEFRLPLLLNRFLVSATCNSTNPVGQIVKNHLKKYLHETEHPISFLQNNLKIFNMDLSKLSYEYIKYPPWILIIPDYYY